MVLIRYNENAYVCFELFPILVHEFHCCMSDEAWGSPNCDWFMSWQADISFTPALIGIENNVCHFCFVSSRPRVWKKIVRGCGRIWKYWNVLHGYWYESPVFKNKISACLFNLISTWEKNIPPSLSPTNLLSCSLIVISVRLGFESNSERLESRSKIAFAHQIGPPSKIVWVAFFRYIYHCSCWKYEYTLDQRKSSLLLTIFKKILPAK